MPKVIENLRGRLLEEARQELFEQGFQALNIRTVAAKCNVAVGTFYNYFSSKELLAASVILEDWNKSIHKMEIRVAKAEDLQQGLFMIYQELLQFEMLYHDVFLSGASVNNKYSSNGRHQKLREHLAEPILHLCERLQAPLDAFTAVFLAENLLNFSLERMDYSKLQPVFHKLLN